MTQPASAYFLSDLTPRSTRATLSILVDNEVGALARVVGLFSGRGYNIESLTVAETDHQKHTSRITIVTSGTPQIIEQIKARSIPAVFIETTVNPQLIERVAADTGVKKLGPLYSDSLGAPGSGAETYSGMMSLNVRMITEGLGGAYAPFVEPAP